MRKQTKRVLSTIGVTAILLGGATAAYAYWTASGTGTGTGTTGTSLAINAVQDTTITNLRPGGAAQNISGHFNNLNAAPVYVTSVTVSIVSVTGGAGACVVSDYTLANAVIAVGATVTTNDTWGTIPATIAFNNKVTSQDGCKGATVNLGFVVS
jgi:hypothetical protein